MGLPHFKYYDYRLAEAVTSTGQVFIKKTMQVTNEILNTILKTQDDYVLASDTDSVVGDSLVYVNGQQITIASLYDSIGVFTERNDAIQSYVKPAIELKTLSFNTNTETVEERPIKYVMKHRVKKRMYKITVGDKSVTVTEDHSIIVQRDGQYVSVKPSELTRTDVLVKLTTHQGVSLYGTDKRSNFLVEDLGIQEIDVYDIEVDENHNFFANDILVHNSVYFCVEKIVDILGKGKTKHEIVNMLEKFVFEVLQPTLNKKLTVFAKTMGINDCKIFYKLECIGDAIIFVAKKRYAFDILYSEGIRYAEPKMKVMGIEIVRSSTPNVVKSYLKEALTLCLRTNEPTLQKKVREVKQSFMKESYWNISFPRGINGLSIYGDDASIYKKGCPIQVRGALVYNHTLERLGIDSKYPKINDADKVKFVALKMPNPLHESVIAFPSRLPTEMKIDQYVDYKVQFEKAFLAPLENILDAIGWEAEEKVKLDFD